ncbi:2-phosphosulfolactate phosphatase [Paenibacillus sp. FSL R7-0345]|uniref:2-phosphosulfolactate phosphatase n=1 Tax=Paenibacillus sp. FSL R7-0345 TaxID=2954535 RepID=UPI00315A2EB9
MFFDQSPYDLKLDWGQRGARAAAERGDIVIFVDVLSFSSTVVTAVQHKANIYTHAPPVNDQVKAYAKELGADIIRGRAEAVRAGGHSMSPLTFSSADYDRNFILCTLNGAACTRIAAQAPALLIGSLLNVSAVADTANKMKLELGRAVTVVPCGEKWPDAIGAENNLRPGIEDYLGAGLILSRLSGSRSPEAQICIGALQSSGQRIGELIWESSSGRELRERGFEADVTYCCQMDISYAVPVLKDNRFVNGLRLAQKR